MAGKVLVVDDSITLRLFVSRTLAAAGFATVDASDGMEALELLVRAEPGDVLAVVADITMPRMSGLELLEAVHERCASRPPFLFLTTERKLEQVVRASALGATAWLLKPFKPQALIASLDKLVPRAAHAVRPTGSDHYR
jgi:two-component system chemotaxis response regulator CheY